MLNTILTAIGLSSNTFLIELHNNVKTIDCILIYKNKKNSIIYLL
jgi:hypothetical protein